MQLCYVIKITIKFYFFYKYFFNIILLIIKLGHYLFKYTIKTKLHTKNLYFSLNILFVLVILGTYLIQLYNMYIHKKTIIQPIQISIFVQI